MPSTTKRQKAVARINALQMTGLQPSARELFPYLRRRLLESRPLLEAEHVVEYEHTFRLHDGRLGTWTQRKTVPAKYGKPTFRNAIDAEGRHV